MLQLRGSYNSRSQVARMLQARQVVGKSRNQVLKTRDRNGNLTGHCTSVTVSVWSQYRVPHKPKNVFYRSFCGAGLLLPGRVVVRPLLVDLRPLQRPPRPRGGTPPRRRTRTQVAVVLLRIMIMTVVK